VNQRPGKPALGILAILIALLVIGNSATRSRSPHSTEPARPSGTAPEPEQGESTVASPTPAPTPLPEIQGQDRYYQTRRFRNYERQQQIARPAYQHLPYRTSQVRIDITNVTSDGRIVLTITPLGPDVNPRAEYGKFLDRFHDPGSAYLASYARYDG
jgi:hypothetical protein